jgi:hypothetical protein
VPLFWLLSVLTETLLQLLLAKLHCAAGPAPAAICILLNKLLFLLLLMLELLLLAEQLLVLRLMLAGM